MTVHGSGGQVSGATLTTSIDQAAGTATLNVTETVTGTAGRGRLVITSWKATR